MTDRKSRANPNVITLNTPDYGVLMRYMQFSARPCTSSTEAEEMLLTSLSFMFRTKKTRC